MFSRFRLIFSFLAFTRLANKDVVVEVESVDGSTGRTVKACKLKGKKQGQNGEKVSVRLLPYRNIQRAAISGESCVTTHLGTPKSGKSQNGNQQQFLKHGNKLIKVRAIDSAGL
jgi:hypothetical protein